MELGRKTHQEADIALIQGVVECGLRRAVRLPRFGEVHGEPHVDVDDPVVREVLVHDFPHLRLFVVESFGGEVKDDVEHRGLRGEGGEAMVGHWVGGALVIDVVGSKAVDQHEHEVGVDGNAAVKAKGELSFRCPCELSPTQIPAALFGASPI